MGTSLQMPWCPSQRCRYHPSSKLGWHLETVHSPFQAMIVTFSTSQCFYTLLHTNDPFFSIILHGRVKEVFHLSCSHPKSQWISKQAPTCFLDCPVNSASLQGFTLLSSSACQLSEKYMPLVPRQGCVDGWAPLGKWLQVYSLLKVDPVAAL